MCNPHKYYKIYLKNNFFALIIIIYAFLWTYKTKISLHLFICASKTFLSFPEKFSKCGMRHIRTWVSIYRLKMNKNLVLGVFLLLRVDSVCYYSWGLFFCISSSKIFLISFRNTYIIWKCPKVCFKMRSHF